MDLQLAFRTLWRFRVIAILGFGLAVLLTFLTVARVSFASGTPSVSYRQDERWTAATTLFITHEGFALGRALFTDRDLVPVQSGNPDSGLVPRYADPGRFASYAVLYARLATSDTVRRRMLRDGPLNGDVSAAPVTAAENPTNILPMLEILGSSTSVDAAVALARRSSRALIEYIEAQQEEARIPQDKRVVVDVINQPRGAVLAEGRHLTRPAFVFVAVMMMVVGLIFVLENMRPRGRPLAAAEDPSAPPVDAARRSATR